MKAYGIQLNILDVFEMRMGRISVDHLRPDIHHSGKERYGLHDEHPAIDPEPIEDAGGHTEPVRAARTVRPVGMNASAGAPVAVTMYDAEGRIVRACESRGSLVNLLA